MSYNGWSNWETWITTMWYGDTFIALAEEMVSEEEEPDSTDLADFKTVIEDVVWDDWVEQVDNKFGLFADFSRNLLDFVNWAELANHYLSDAWQER